MHISANGTICEENNLKIRLRVLGSEQIQSMDCVVLGKLGDVYPCIDNGFHPHCGPKEYDYPETYSAVDWMIDNRVNRGCKSVQLWLAQQLRSCYDDFLNLEFAIKSIFAGISPCNRTVEMCTKLWESIENVDFDSNRSLEYASNIDFYLNQNFLRVRAGGKLNSSSASSIYFRISSKDYNWRDVIEDFLWDTFKNIADMPQLIWIGHDAETNPPEVVLFEGTPEDLFTKFDSTVLASTKFK